MPELIMLIVSCFFMNQQVGKELMRYIDNDCIFEIKCVIPCIII